jgi:histidinol-phosphate phosphatase family protein
MGVRGRKPRAFVRNPVSQTAHPIRQAVVLAGGLGTRLRPLTDTCPKPLVALNGRPFLDYLIDMLRAQGIARILLLLGYRADDIVAHYRAHPPQGIEVDFQISPVEDETGRRLKRAASRLDDSFLLLYGDNYWPLDLARAWAQRKTAGRPLQITVYANKDGRSRDNVRVDDARVAVYDKSRTAPDLRGVDIGFALVDRTVVEALPEDNISFEAYTYPRAVASGTMSAYVTEHRYYSIGSLDRLDETARFLAQAPTVLIDRDGVLNRKMGCAEYVCDWSQWQWMPGALNALAALHGHGYRVIVATNQPGIARGKLTPQGLSDIHERMQADVRAAGGDIAAIYHCPHGWDEGCDCRKPAPGMLFQAQKDFALDLSRTPFLGDDDRDGQAAAAAGCRFIQISDDHPLPAAVDQLLSRAA